MDPYHDTHRFVNHKIMRYVSTFLLSTWTQYTYRIVCPRSTHTQGFICFAYALALGAPPAAMPCGISVPHSTKLQHSGSPQQQKYQQVTYRNVTLTL